MKGEGEKLETLSKDNFPRIIYAKKKQRNALGRKKRILIQEFFLRWKCNSMFLC